jgi:hypothetical protein
VAAVVVGVWWGLWEEGRKEIKKEEGAFKSGGGKTREGFSGLHV